MMSKNKDSQSLEKLGEKIEKAQARLSQKDEGSSSKGVGALRVSTDLLAGVVVGCFAGYYLDSFFSTSPLMFILCFFLGVAGSFVNIYRTAKRDFEQEE